VCTGRTGSVMGRTSVRTERSVCGHASTSAEPSARLGQFNPRLNGGLLFRCILFYSHSVQ
jgi:hypothetical protein